jgi:NADPH:quinone reductase-like Zn-dependent oxidoreductase
MRAWQVMRYGAPTEALDLVDVPDPELQPGEVLVRATASVLNYNEVDGCRGRYLTINPPLPYTLGMECVGEVVGAGEGVEHWLGKRVTASGRGATGSHAELVACPTSMVFEAPEQLGDVEAAAFFYPFHLAHLGLFERGRLAAGETVLVHAAAGGVGSAAVQLAVAAGARVIATCGDDAKAELVRGLGADEVVNYRTTDFTARVLELTDGAGVQVCFDGVGGETMVRSLGCLGRGGRHLVVGFASGIEAEEVPMVNGRTLCFGDFDLVGVILSYVDPQWLPYVNDGHLPVPVPRFNPPTTDMGQAVQAHLLELLGAGKIKPIVGREVPFEDLAKALDDMENRATVGRVVVTR